MTLKIEVYVPEDDVRGGNAANYLARALEAIGFARHIDEVLAEPGPNYEALRAANERIVASRGVMIDLTREDATETELPPATTTEPEAPKRERGKPSPGRARRTKEEIAEDEAAPKTRYFVHPESDSLFTTEDGSRPVGDGLVEEVTAEQYAAFKAKQTPANISTGDERIDPTAPEDAAQDAADEAAEAEAAKAPELTHDDVRAALKKYLDAYGTPAAMEDGPKVLTLVAGKPTAKVSDMATDQETLAKAIAGIEEMLAKDPYKRRAGVLS